MLRRLGRLWRKWHESHSCREITIDHLDRVYSTCAGCSILSLLSRTNCIRNHKAEALMNRCESDQKLVLGHDLSTLQQLEDVGRTFSDEGWAQTVERIVAHHGATYIRERLWVNPPIAYNDLPHILTMARRIKAAGLKFLLDFHYSDFWADPGKQPTPQGWQGQDLSTLANTVYSYTRDVVKRLARQGTPVEMVQTGKEVTNGMLWPQGAIYVDGSTRWLSLRCAYHGAY